jgi:hypothetical protein
VRRTHLCVRVSDDEGNYCRENMMTAYSELWMSKFKTAVDQRFTKTTKAQPYNYRPTSISRLEPGPVPIDSPLNYDNTFK